MVVLDGVVYQVAADGNVIAVSDDVLTPFACVTRKIIAPCRGDEGSGGIISILSATTATGEVISSPVP